MAITINGTGSITGISAGGLPDGVITTDDIAASAITRAKMGYAGAILQVVQTVKTDTFSRTSSSSDFGDITGLSVSITPTSTANKILIFASVSCSNGTAGNRLGIRLAVNSSAITAITGDASGTRTRATSAMWANTAVNDLSHLTLQYLHSPSSTSAQSYSVQGSAEGSSVFWCNRSGGNADSNGVYVGASSITVMEVAG
jgi:hypothetical protein